MLLMGQRFVSNDVPWSQVLQQLDLSSLSAEEFVGALEAVAQAAGSRALVMILRHRVPLLSFPRPLVPEHDRQVWIPCWRALVEAATNRAFRISPHALGEPCAPLISLAKIAGEGVARAGTGGLRQLRFRTPGARPPLLSGDLLVSW